MPELPEVETVRRGLEPAMKGRVIRDVILRRPDLRMPIPADLRDQTAGKKVMKLLRRGKYILVMLEDGQGFGLHLGMSGRIRIESSSVSNDFTRHDHVVFVMDNGTKIIFNDPRRFGMVFSAGKKWQTEKPFSAMGPEPLEKDFSGVALAKKLEGKNTSIKVALLDQRVVSGVGNIYACEALFRAGIDPEKKAKLVQGERAAKLAKAIRHVLELAIEAGGSTLRDHRKTDGEMGYFQHHFSVYDRAGEACPSCTCNVAKTGGIRRFVQAGRSTFYCPRKQK